MTKLSWLLCTGLCLLAPSLSGCDDSLDASDDPSGPFWDSEWTFRATTAGIDGAEPLPLPTDLTLLERVRSGEDGGPPASDVLEGAVLIFEIDGRIRVQPAGAEVPEDFLSNYRVIDGSLLRASIRKSTWFPSSYSFNDVDHTLLIQPEAGAGGTVMGLVLDIVERTLFSGALNSPTARVSVFLLQDPRVVARTDGFLHDVIHGRVESIPVQNSDDATTWIIGLLRQTGVVAADVPDATLRPAIAPIVDDLLLLESEGITQALLDRLLATDLVTQVIAPDRVARVLPFALYHRVLDSDQLLASVRSLDILLVSSP